MNFKELAQLVAKSAPLLGSVLAGPAGASIGALIAAKFGGDPNNPNQLVSQIIGDPQAALKLVQIQTTHELELQRMLITMAENQLKYEAEEREIAAQDRDSARMREVEVAAHRPLDKTPAILAYILTLGTFLSLGYLFLASIPETNKELVIAIVSSLTAVWVAAMAYYHGSSAGSRHKDLVLGQQGTSILNENITQASLANLNLKPLENASWNVRDQVTTMNNSSADKILTRQP